MISIGVIGALTLWTRTPLLFPALGASAFILTAFPSAPPAAPRNVIGAHTLAAAAGWLCFWAFGLVPGGASILSGGGWEHVLAPALALGITTGLMLALDLAHPPAGATTLIVSLGFLPQPWHIAMVGASALLLVLVVRVVSTLTAGLAPAGAAPAAPAREPQAQTPTPPVR